jgi:putative tryptophan/tyrosine transport system substrate-binding protein
MSRRVVDFIITLTLVVLAALTDDAQPRRNIPVVGVLEPGPDMTPPRPCLQGFAQGLHQLGYREGHNLRLEYRYADFQPDRLQALAAEVARLQPDLIFTHSPLGAQAAQQAAPTIPIVVGVGTDLVEQGLIVSLPRPGGNLTGLELRDHELLGKRLELLKQALPQITRVAVLVDPALGAHHHLPGAFEREARALGLHLQRVEAGDPETFDTAFGAMTEDRADALVLMGGVRFTTHRERLIELAHRHRLPTMAAARHFAEAGSLMAYGASAGDLCRRATVLVGKILKGAKPADLPVEQPTTFELVINLKTAQALGLTIPPPLLFQATEVLR